ncbi:hypothetical protein P1J78_21645 [Psychromarinibacter sp. C21-152]|uniref:Uncharacterized protein n=1 Tax=Psychromarinibacter sediminicola TaxID=3033385 RepID=A0AAE3NWE3_9RHOB|nr:hypothetical protein [Psychromarinibacter sediminicola]MDF0603341.1 hypothetical protein [Psychromarinibacter sediminicola]
MQIRTTLSLSRCDMPEAVTAELRAILAEGGLCRSLGVEWILDNLDRRAEVRP